MPAVLKGDDSGVRPRTGFTAGNDLCFRVQRVARKQWGGELDAFETKIRNGGGQRRIGYGQTNE